MPRTCPEDERAVYARSRRGRRSQERSAFKSEDRRDGDRDECTENDTHESELHALIVARQRQGCGSC